MGKNILKKLLSDRHSGLLEIHLKCNINSKINGKSKKIPLIMSIIVNSDDENYLLEYVVTAWQAHTKLMREDIMGNFNFTIISTDAQSITVLVEPLP